MPELPEVETVKNQSIPLWVGNTLEKVEVFLPRIVRNLSSFLKEAPGKTCTHITRRGKYLLFHFSSNDVLLVHLRMEGKFILLNPNEEKTKHTHVLFTFTNGRRIAYDDSRTFGVLQWMKEEECKEEPMLTKLGPEPFEISLELFYQRLQRRSDYIKEALLSQEVVAGIGNIYADEILFAAGISPFSIAKRIPFEKVRLLLSKTKEVLKHAIELGGSTIRSYHPSRDVDGKFQITLQVYDKEKEPCPRCHAPLKKVFLAGRGTTYCRFCQKEYRSSFPIGIVGKIAAGKSTVLSLLKKKYPVFSADEIVHQFYKDERNLEQLRKRFPQAFEGETFSTSKMREILVSSSKKKKELERILHPYVEKKMRKEIRTHQGIIFLEIPLLFESQMEDLCEKILGINATKETQIRHLKKRKEKNIEQALSLNASTRFDESLSKMDYVLENNGTLTELKRNLTAILKQIEQDIK